MLEIYKEALLGQFEASLSTLAKTVEACPDSLWYETVLELKFCQVVFHTLFFTDVYLGKNLAALKEQAFHQQNAEIFDDYEELERRRQKATCDKPFIREYFSHCRSKVQQSLSAETEESLAHKPGFDWLSFSRAEVHVYNVRHIHHHAAQLSLHLNFKTNESIPWQGTGWDEPKPT